MASPRLRRTKGYPMADDPGARSAPIILVAGFWLGAWAWDDVVPLLRQAGHDVTALTLPGLESADVDRSRVTLDDHVNAIVHAIRAADAPVVLAVHSAAGFSGYAASDRIPERIAAMVYVDTAPARERSIPTSRRSSGRWSGTSWSAEENIDGLSETQLADFPEARGPGAGRADPARCRADERCPARHPEHLHLHWLQRRAVPGLRARAPRAGPSWPGSRSCATSRGSTCPPATGRCGRSHASWRQSSGTSLGPTLPASDLRLP